MHRLDQCHDAGTCDRKPAPAPIRKVERQSCSDGKRIATAPTEAKRDAKRPMRRAPRSSAVRPDQCQLTECNPQNRTLLYPVKPRGTSARRQRLTRHRRRRRRTMRRKRANACRPPRSSAPRQDQCHDAAARGDPQTGNCLNRAKQSGHVRFERRRLHRRRRRRRGGDTMRRKRPMSAQAAGRLPPAPRPGQRRRQCRSAKPAHAHTREAERHVMPSKAHA